MRDGNEHNAFNDRGRVKPEHPIEFSPQGYVHLEVTRRLVKDAFPELITTV